MIPRTIAHQILSDLKPGHVTALFGARRTGKTMIMESIRDQLDGKRVLLLNGEDYDVAAILSSQRQEVLKSLVAGYDFLFIDEAQSIQGIGKNLKLLVDTQRETGVFVTGSASFDLRSQIGEPLTGRSRFFHLYPLSISEVSGGFAEAAQKLPLLLVYGAYPQVYQEENLIQKRAVLEGIKNGYLLKDVLQLSNIKDGQFVMNLLRLLAFQVGNDISYQEMARNLGSTVKTIQRYLDILEKTYIIFRLYGFSRNLRKEISKSPRVYFWDNGIRNAIISNLNPLETREDTGKLWENFCISERIKRQTYGEKYSSFFFWRTYDQQEIDLIEETAAQLHAYEFKWGNREVSPPKAFAENYPEASFQTITRLNFSRFLLG
jgi:uncharacterized protein